MPIYEYKCKKCDETFEVIQKMSAPAPKCESCGSKRTERLMSAASFVLKGSGWYATDYGKQNKDPQKESQKDSKSESSESKSKSSEKKSETTKADSKKSEKSSKSKSSGKTAAA
ncbi:zinc ribbon domain-containing protein [Myxococcota bacterium]|nr:zinc ribbon domain-containing protein [Myxococcota bacterium]